MRRLAAVALILLLAIFVILGVRQREQTETTKRICAVQGITYAGILANLGLALEEAVNLSKNASDPKVRQFYANEAPALRATLDGQFKKPPHCGQTFEFTIQITGEKPRHVVTH